MEKRTRHQSHPNLAMAMNESDAGEFIAKSLQSLQAVEEQYKKAFKQLRKERAQLKKEKQKVAEDKASLLKFQAFILKLSSEFEDSTEQEESPEQLELVKRSGSTGF